jgi:hypothetical protein
MYTSKTLALAALAALSLGVGSAMAQDSRAQSNGYWAQPQGASAPATTTRQSTQIQSGSSDMVKNPDVEYRSTITGSGDGSGG